MNKRIIVIGGASGSGKTTIGCLLEETGIPRLITSTTRPMRKGEIDGVDYHFMNVDEVERKQFVETTIYNGHTYGLTVQSIREGFDKSDTVVVVMDQNGAKAIKNLYPEEAFVVYLSVSKEQIISRMKERGETEESIQERVLHAERTGELEAHEAADLVLEDMTPGDSVQWVLACVTGGMNVGEIR